MTINLNHNYLIEYRGGGVTVLTGEQVYKKLLLQNQNQKLDRDIISVKYFSEINITNDTQKFILCVAAPKDNLFEEEE
ncbi:MAG TPA: hypothetical protein PLM63_04145 [bacterium]|nr:hypothetical protein [bacterium]